MRQRLAPLLGLLLCMVTVSSSPARGSLGAIWGEVVTSAGEKIPGASVTLEGVGTTRTDALGRFRFRNVPRGNYRITASKEGFSTESRHLLVIGGRRNEIVITLSGSGPLAPVSEGLDVVVPIERRGPAILVKAHLNHRLSSVFIVDTGASLTVISTRVAETLGIRGDSGMPMIPLQTATGIVRVPLVEVESIKVGQAEVQGVEAVIHDIPGIPAEIAGLLGLSFLGRFKVSIDMANRRMILGRPD